MTKTSATIEFIRSHTEVSSSPLIPELQLHMITDTCPMWRMDESGVAKLGISSPYWGFCWPGGHALARYLLDHPDTVRDKTVLDFGTGGGIAALAAGLSQANKVVASDTDSFALEAVKLNATLNHLEIETTDRDLIGEHSPDWNVILVADVCYEAALTQKITSWLEELYEQGVQILLADPNRGWLQQYSVEEVACYETPCDIDCRGTYTQDTFVYSFRA
jgi:predicted nicotinamide N-methyase